MIRDILQKKGWNVATIRPDASCLEATQLMAKHNIGALVVVDETNQIQGVISERDIVRRLAEGVSDLTEQPVNALMTCKGDVIVALLDDSVDYASTVMINSRVRHLPIMDPSGRLVGIVTIGDVVKFKLHATVVENRMLQDYITGAYPVGAGV